LRSGRALPHELPEAHRHEWILPAAAVTRLFVTESLLAGIPQTRWREALPNLLEPQVLWSLEECHCALAPAPDAQGRRVVAVMERAWMNFIHGAFSGRRGRLILSSSHDWAPIGCRGEWVFPVWTLRKKEVCAGGEMPLGKEAAYADDGRRWGCCRGKKGWICRR